MMNITGPLDTLTQLTLSAPKATIAQWSVGQVLQAIVLNQPQAGVVSLRIGAAVVEARTALPLVPQQTIALEVLETGKQPVLKLVPQAPPADIAAQTLRTSLPRQAPLGPVLQNIISVLRAVPQESSPRPAITQAVQQVLDNLPQAATVTKGEGLRAALANSGLWLEAKMAQPAANAAPGAPLAQTPTAPDLKANLLRLLNALTIDNTTPRTQAPVTSARASESPPAAYDVASMSKDAQPKPQTTPPSVLDAGATVREMMDKPQAPSPGAPTQNTPVPSLAPDDAIGKLTTLVESALARIQVNQLHTLANDGPLNPTWVTDLPVRRGEQIDTLEMHIQREEDSGHDAGTAQHRWSVWVNFNFEPLGPLSARVSLMGGEVSAGLWAERPQTVDLVRTHLEALQGQLVDAGLKVQQLTCMPGPAPHRPNPKNARPGLVDIRA